jgi:hypothetical protein
VKPWLKNGDPAQSGAGGLNVNGTTGGGYPLVLLDYLAARSDSIAEVGLQRIRGISTTRYHTVLDLARLAANISLRLRGGVRQTLDAHASLLGTRVLRTDVWIDSAGRVRRERLALSNVPGVQEPNAVTITLDFSEFGVPLRIEAPPASEVVDLTSPS